MSALDDILTSTDYDDVDELAEEALRPIHRTPPLYPTSGPEDGVTWAEFFKAVKEPYREVVEDGEDAPAAVVLEMGHDLAEPLKAPGAPGTLAKRLHGQQWTVRVRASRVRVPATFYAADSAATGARKGDPKAEAHEVELFCVLGVKRGGGDLLAVDATWSRKVGGSFKFDGATTYDPYLGEEWRSTSLKPRPQREIEFEEGIQPPIGLGEWLDIVAPTPASKKRAAAKAAQEEEGVWAA